MRSAGASWAHPGSTQFRMGTGCVLGAVGALAPFALAAQPGVTVVTCVAAALTFLAFLAPVILPVLVITEIAAAEDGDLIREYFLAGKARAVRVALLSSALRGWGAMVCAAVLSAAVLGLASVIVGSGVGAIWGNPSVAGAPIMLLALGSVHACAFGFGLSLLLGSQRLAIGLHVLFLLCLVSFSALPEDERAHHFALGLPAAPFWSRLGEADVGSIALRMPTEVLVANVVTWMLCSVLIAFISLRWLGGLSIAARIRGG